MGHVMRTFIGIAASAALVGAFLVPATTATAAESKSIGVTAMRVNLGVTEALLRANVYVNGENPGGSTILAPGKLALEFPVSGVKKGKASHAGQLFLSHSGAMGWRTVVVSNLTADLRKGTLKGRVYATDTDLGTYTIFRLTKIKNPVPTTTYTIKLAPGAAQVLNSALGVRVFSEGMRIGSGATTFLPE
jgi:hypothetical protein